MGVILLPFYYHAHWSEMSWHLVEIHFFGKFQNAVILVVINTTVHCTEVQFASFQSGKFITVKLVNPPEIKLAKCISYKYQSYI
jgi:hypothetical protein